MPRLAEWIRAAGVVLEQIGTVATASNEELEESERSGGQVVAGGSPFAPLPPLKAPPGFKTFPITRTCGWIAGSFFSISSAPSVRNGLPPLLPPPSSGSPHQRPLLRRQPRHPAALHPGCAVDLVYLDPPFNSNRDYNVIFRDESGNATDAQLLAFEDTWHWGPSAEATYAYLTNTARHEGRVPDKVSTIIAALRAGIGENQMMAYLVEMAVRLVELHRVLKPTGSLYLHCDPTASHYLKLVLDAIFGPKNFVNEIVWKRTSSPQRQPLLGQASTTAPLLLARIVDHVESVSFVRTIPIRAKFYSTSTDDRGRYRYDDRLDGAAGPSPEPGYRVGARKGEHAEWAATGDSATRWIELDREGRIECTEERGMPVPEALPRRDAGAAGSDIWDDIPPINSQAKERLGYPTQKPLAAARTHHRRVIQPGRRRPRPVLRVRHRADRRPEARTASGSGSTSPTSRSPS